MMESKLARSLYKYFSKDYGVGKFYFEMYVRNAGFQSDVKKYYCDMAIHFPEPDYLIGIEVKDWHSPIYRSIVKKEFEGYKGVFDLFYIVGREFPTVDFNDEDFKKVGAFKITDEDYSIKKHSSADFLKVYTHRRNRFLNALDLDWKRKKSLLKNEFPNCFDVNLKEIKKKNNTKDLEDFV